MTSRTKKPGKDRAPRATLLEAGRLSGPMASVHVEICDRPPVAKTPRTIHPRRPAPPVPRGKPVPDPRASPAVDLDDTKE